MELWAQDEARLGLKPVVRRVRAPVGERPVAHFKRGYKWTYLYGFVHPESGEVFWLVLPTVNTALFSMALREFAQEVELLDQAETIRNLTSYHWWPQSA